MVHGMASSTIDQWGVGIVFTVVDEDGPEIDKSEESNVCKLLQGKQEGKQMVRDRLSEAVDWVEGMRSERGRHDPFVVWLVESLVDTRMVQTAVYPVDQKVREQDEEWKLDNVVKREGCLGETIVHLRVSTDFGQHTCSREYGHNWDGLHCLGNLEADLVLEIFRVLRSGLVKDKDIR